MFFRRSNLKRPTTEIAGMIFNLVNMARARRGDQAKEPLPASMGKDPEFIGMLLGMVDILTTRMGGNYSARTNIIDLLDSLFGFETNSNQPSEGLLSARALLEMGPNNELLYASLERTEDALLESNIGEDDIIAIVQRFF